MLINNQTLDALLEKAKLNPRLRINLDLRNSNTDTSQRMLNAMWPGTQMKIHKHANTSETVIILKGIVNEIFYNEDGIETHRFLLDSVKGRYGIQIPQNQWHNIEPVIPSVVITMKDGRYFPSDESSILESSNNADNK